MEPKTELQRNAIEAARLKELTQFQRALDLQWLNSRMEDGRMGRCLALIKREAEMEKEYHERTDHASIVNAKAKREQAMGAEIAKIRQEEICWAGRQQHLRRKDAMLKDLTRKLRSGYTCRDIQKQILDNQYRKLQEKATEERLNKTIYGCNYDEKAIKEKEYRDKVARNSAYCKEIQQQLVNRQLQKQCQYEDTLIEKKMLEEVYRTMADEDQRELQQKNDMRAKTRVEIEMFQKARDAWKEKQKLMVIKEEKEIEAQQLAMRQRSANVAAEKAGKLLAREELGQRIAAKKLADEEEQAKRDDIIRLLQEQEYIEKNIQDEKNDKEKAERIKRDTKESLSAQMENRRRLAAEQKIREAEFRKENEMKAKEDELKEREKERKKREKGRMHAQELLKQIEADKKRKQKEEEDEQARVVDILNYDKHELKEIARERAFLIETHGPHVLGYLQAGVLKAGDLPALRAGANKRPDLAQMDIEGMFKTKKMQPFPRCNDQCMIIREY